MTSIHTRFVAAGFATFLIFTVRATVALAQVEFNIVKPSTTGVPGEEVA